MLVADPAVEPKMLALELLLEALPKMLLVLLALEF